MVEQAETVDVEFSLPDNSSKTFATCPVVGVHDDFDVAFIALPEEVNIPTLDITDKSITDGTPVFSAGFPALGDKPSWQLGQGIVSNASAQIKSLTNGKELPLVQHTAQVDAGSSGGPLLIRDENAAAGFAVVGINTWKAFRPGKYQFCYSGTRHRRFPKKLFHRSAIPAYPNRSLE